MNNIHDFTKVLSRNIYFGTEFKKSWNFFATKVWYANWHTSYRVMTMYTVNNTYVNVFCYCTYELIKAAGSACTYYNFIISFLWCCVLCPPGTLPVVTCRQLVLFYLLITSTVLLWSSIRTVKEVTLFILDITMYVRMYIM